MPPEKTFTCTADDRQFACDFEAGVIAAGDFHHREHVRLAYVYLTQGSPQMAIKKMRASLKHFLDRNQVDPAKYHETITRAWILAVAHFRTRSAATASADEFIAANPQLLDGDIMLSHYSRERLYSEAARKGFLAPDLEPIPD